MSALWTLQCPSASIDLIEVSCCDCDMDTINLAHILAYVQSRDREFQVSVMSPTPVRIMAQEGERVSVAGVMLPTGGPPTLMLPMGSEVERSVVLCNQRAHVRQLKEDNGHTWGGGESGSVGASSTPCFYR